MVVPERLERPTLRFVVSRELRIDAVLRLRHAEFVPSPIFSATFACCSSAFSRCASR